MIKYLSLPTITNLINYSSDDIEREREKADCKTFANHNRSMIVIRESRAPRVVRFTLANIYSSTLSPGCWVRSSYAPKSVRQFLTVFVRSRDVLRLSRSSSSSSDSPYSISFFAAKQDRILSLREWTYKSFRGDRTRGRGGSHDGRFSQYRTPQWLPDTAVRAKRKKTKWGEKGRRGRVPHRRSLDGTFSSADLFHTR